MRKKKRLPIWIALADDDDPERLEYMEKHKDELLGLSPPNTKIGMLQRLAWDHLKNKDSNDEIPTSIRFVFYELEQASHLSKRTIRLDGRPGKRKPADDLTEAITNLRNLDLVPWESLVDESRHVHRNPCWDTVADCMASMVDVATLDRFPGVPRPVILCESRGIGGILARGVADEYCVNVVPCGGQTNGFLRTKAAPYLQGDVVPLYVGDFDLAGGDIEDNAKSVLEQALGHKLESWERLMLTGKQCKKLQRDGVEPVEKTDNRFKPARKYLAYEAEALGQNVVMDIIRKRLEAMAPEPLEAVLEREEEERQEFKVWLERGR
jgi:hypothetical protein